MMYVNLALSSYGLNNKEVFQEKYKDKCVCLFTACFYSKYFSLINVPATFSGIILT